MIAFFFTMPISRMMPMIAMIAEVLAGDHQREQRADAGRRQRRQDRDRVDVALVEHAEHDVHRDDRREDQQQLVVERRVERERRALEVDLHARRHAELRASPPRSPCTASPSDAPRREVERHRRRRELADVVDRERRRAVSTTLRDRVDSGTCVRAAGRGDGATCTYRCRRARRARAGTPACTSSTTRYWLDCVKIVEIEPLAERVVQRVVDRGRRDAEAAGGRAVDVDVRLQAAVLQVAGDVGELRQLPQPVDQLRHPRRRARRRSASSTRELILRAADAVLDRQVLHRLHVQRDAVDVARACGCSRRMTSLALRVALRAAASG